MWFDQKCRVIKDLVETGCEVEEYLETRTTYGSKEWKLGKRFLEDVVYARIRAVFPLREQLEWYMTKRLEVGCS